MLSCYVQRHQWQITVCEKLKDEVPQVVDIMYISLFLTIYYIWLYELTNMLIHLMISSFTIFEQNRKPSLTRSSKGDLDYWHRCCNSQTRQSTMRYHFLSASRDTVTLIMVQGQDHRYGTTKALLEETYWHWFKTLNSWYSAIVRPVCCQMFCQHYDSSSSSSTDKTPLMFTRL